MVAYLIPWVSLGGKGVQVDEQGKDRTAAAANGIQSIKSIYELKDVLSSLM